MHTLGYYTGWAIAIVLVFVIPLMIVFIEYMRRVNRQLKDIKGKGHSFIECLIKGG